MARGNFSKKNLSTKIVTTNQIEKNHGNNCNP